MKKNVAVCFSTTSNRLFTVANVMIGIEKNSPGFVDDIYIFTDDTDHKDCEIIKKIRKTGTVKFVSLNKKFQKLGIANNTRFTAFSFGLFEMFDLLDEYKNVIYLDSDLIIKGDISGLIGNGEIAMLPTHTSRKISESFKKTPPGIDGDMRTRNSGVVVVNDALEYKGLTDFCYQVAVEQMDNNAFADQSILRYSLHLKGH